MEVWRKTAAEASARSLTYINATNAVVEAIMAARQRYALASEDCRRFRPGVHPPPNAGQGASAGGDFVELAIDRIKRFSRFQAVLVPLRCACAHRAPGPGQRAVVAPQVATPPRRRCPPRGDGAALPALGEVARPCGPRRLPRHAQAAIAASIGPCLGARGRAAPATRDGRPGHGGGRGGADAPRHCRPVLRRLDASAWLIARAAVKQWLGFPPIKVQMICRSVSTA
uniref:BTR2 n=1 Tax=Hordeum vulgare subsp. vulgare TaxID=112509 RepID=A0A0K1RKV9_HORVV|nr:BTR2 isoform B2Isof23 [Hordeum vulgare subsp. vulgare]AKV62205.1 BTR2 isoform B2Isof23 [Hordeum vulgare subsp. vulgare]AKV62206.1 BTR2 isoform B2Isof23 [Hordeum vulgare subsp. vulgare]AKV62207.1 BTR2 isoform B2Isof23 [Hordeum vulgare subsp. vulgare]AKV62208.1 BTR2 isoform B2Isof23 [Hordeum vulgare subsp. vulgare]